MRSTEGGSTSSSFHTKLQDKNDDTNATSTETKELKRRVRNVIEPGRDLGHVDRDHGQGQQGTAIANANAPEASEKGDQVGGAVDGDVEAKDAARNSVERKNDPEMQEHRSNHNQRARSE